MSAIDPAGPSAAPSVEFVVDQAPAGGKWRRWVAPVFLALFLVLATLSVAGVWARLTILNTDVFVQTVAPLSSDATVQVAISEKLTDEIMEALQIDSTVGATISGITGAPLRTALQETVYSVSLEAVESDEFSQIWETIATLGHDKMLVVVGGGEENLIVSQGGEVALDLTPIIAQVNQRLVERGIEPFEGTPVQDLGLSIVIFQSEDLAQAQEIFDLLDQYAWILPILALASLLLYLLISTNRWSSLIHASFGLGIAMLLLLVALRVVRWRYLDALDPTINQAVAAEFFDTLLRYLRGSAQYIALGSLILAGVFTFFRPQAAVPAPSEESLSLRERIARDHARALENSPRLKTTESTIATHRTIALAIALAIPVLLIIGWDTIASMAPAILFVLALLAAAAIVLIPKTEPSTDSQLEPVLPSSASTRIEQLDS